MTPGLSFHPATFLKLAAFVFLLSNLTLLGDDRVSLRKHAWTASKIQGVPDRPPAYTLERVFPKLKFRAPISLHRYPEEHHGQTRWVVIEQAGKIKSFVADQDVDQADLMIDLASPRPKLSEWGDGKDKGLNVFSLAFHPRFKENRYVYICYIIQAGNFFKDGTHIARYKVRDTNPPTIDFDSETTILRCDSGGHNGCTLEFGPDGYLYVSLGDLADPTPPDPLRTGQDISDLYASILRIDVDKASTNAGGQELAYAIPSDNPFTKLTHARGEVYAYGLRNPWRMSFDSKSGDLWVGDVGWEAFEMVHRVRPGSNLGWSIKEGPGDVMPDLKVGPTPIQPAEIVLNHGDAASVTGGFVYHGNELPNLKGKYIFGDWITRRYWAASFDETRVTALEEIAVTEVKPIGFATDKYGELFVLEYIQWDQDGGIYQFRNNPSAETFQAGVFPDRLSETGLFSSTHDLSPQSGVASYSINSTMWMEGATSQFHLAIPDSGSAELLQNPRNTFDWFNSKVFFPKGTVLARTYSFGDRKVETQLSHYEGPNDWRFYTFRWLDDQSDAVLVPAQGLSVELTLGSGESVRWNYGSRTQCKICHTPWSGNAMGFLEEQLRKPGEDTDSWRTLLDLGLINTSPDQPIRDDDRYQALVSTRDPHASLNNKVRSYLHSNCAHCHQFGGNGSAAFDVRWDRTLAETKIVDATPMKGACNLEDAKLVSPGYPDQSVLFSRMAKQGTGRMPHIGSELVDVEGCKLIAQWILSLPKNENLRQSYGQLIEPIQKGDLDQRVAAAKELLKSISGAMLVARALSDNSLHRSVLERIYPLIVDADPVIREYVEFLLPRELQTKRLGNNFDKSELLTLVGDATRGAELFRRGLGQCNQCHQVGDVGKAIGPGFEKLATRYPTRLQLLEQLMQPSLNIAAEYRAITFLTQDGQTIVGRVLSREGNDIRVALQDGSEKHINAEEIELEQISQVSLMPEGLLATLTAQQAIDLLEYLNTFK